MKGIDLSICIPTYNRIETLKLCIDRVICARKGFEDNVEIIISDNGSNDGTYEYLKTLQYKNFYVYHNEENLGFNRNVILLLEKYSSGIFAWTLGDDDYISSSSIKNFMLIKDDTDLLLMKHKLVCKEDLCFECQSERILENVKGSYFQSVDDIAQDSNLFATFMSCAIFNREMFNRVDKSDIMINDWQHFKNVFFNGFCLYKAFENSNNIYSTKDNFIFIVPIKKDWDEKLAVIYQYILPNFYREIPRKKRKNLKVTKYILFRQCVSMLLRDNNCNKRKLVSNIISTFSLNNIRLFLLNKLRSIKSLNGK